MVRLELRLCIVTSSVTVPIVHVGICQFRCSAMRIKRRLKGYPAFRVAKFPPILCLIAADLECYYSFTTADSNCATLVVYGPVVLCFMAQLRDLLRSH